MNKTLVLFAHPRFEDSKINKRLIQAYLGWEHITFRDLYEDYPDFSILYMNERYHLDKYDSIIFHFPLIWFGIPPLLQLWLDEVLDRKWLYEWKDKNPLKGKKAYIITTIMDKTCEYVDGDSTPFDGEPLLKSLIETIKVNQMTLEGVLTVDNIDRLSVQELEEYYNKVKDIAQNL